jgi:hypothetical protein
LLRKIFVPTREEVTGSWRKLHNAGVHNMYPSPNIIRVIKSRKIRWTDIWYTGRDEELMQNVCQKA